jgi:hypothetical protein
MARNRNFDRNFSGILNLDRRVSGIEAGEDALSLMLLGVVLDGGIVIVDG